MKTKLIAFVVAILIFAMMAVTLVSCTYQVVDYEYGFTHAYISYGDGTVEKIELKSWHDYEDSDQIQVTAKDGRVFLASAYNCVLVKEK